MALSNFKSSSFGSTSTGRVHGFAFGLLVVLIVFSFMCTSVDGIFDKVEVQVINQLDPNTPMGIHCKSKDDDLGEHPSIGYGASIHWKFKINFWVTTLYWCGIWFNDTDSGPQKYGSFNIYEAKRDKDWCGGNCLRYVKRGGIYFDLPGANISQLVYQWPEQS